MSIDLPSTPKTKRSRASQFILRGLAIVLPPVLTVVILAWAARGINDYVIQPISTVVRFTIAQTIQDIEPVSKLERLKGPTLPFYNDGDYYVTLRLYNKLEQDIRRQRASGGIADNSAADRPIFPNAQIPLDWLEYDEVYIPFGDKAVPYEVYQLVARQTSPAPMPTTAIGVYMDYATYRYFPSVLQLSLLAIIIAIAIMYFLGHFVTARIGAWFVNKIETGFLAKVPLVRNVYSSVKQVTDFVLSEQTVEYNRVVAIEYPRRGVWSLGFVTGNSMLEIATAAGRPCVTVLIPSSPVPVTGYTVSVPRNEVVDLNITFDQAFQFCVSCGVLVPPQQTATRERIESELAKRLTESEESHVKPCPDGQRTMDESLS